MVPLTLSGAAYAGTEVVREGKAFKGNGRSGWLTGSEPGTLDHQEGLLTEGESD